MPAFIGTATEAGTTALVGPTSPGEEGDDIYISLHCHRQNDSCIKMDRDASHFSVSLIVRDKATRQRPQTTTFEDEESDQKTAKQEYRVMYK